MNEGNEGETIKIMENVSTVGEYFPKKSREEETKEEEVIKRWL